ncbi:MAG TPA: adenylate/guanylate cyclase domain-containing protein [Gemmataceae bacterium]|nr:adenylate/guanylate cyclase domain-containing protein [Gemmataceae bacterium]
MLRFRLTTKRESQELEHASGPIEFGRGPKQTDVARHVIPDQSVSRDHLRVEELPGGEVRLVNLSQKQPIRLGDERLIPPGGQVEVAPPVWLAMGDSSLEIEGGDGDVISRDSLATIPPPARGAGSAPDVTAVTGQPPSPEKLAQWFETVIDVLRAAAGSAEFYDQTAAALVNLVGLDRGLVLLWRHNRWEPVARKVAREGGHGREFSTNVLRFVVEEKRTFYQAAGGVAPSESLQGVEAVVASPVFDAREQVVGALYGSRAAFGRTAAPVIGPLKAQLVQVLATAVGVGLARLETEAEAARSRVTFEQFFSADLARELQRNPRLLDGQERTITAMFCDIRGFSRLVEGLKPADVCRSVSDVREMLTSHISACEGVVVDYAGDGLLAMWNAPADQPDHAVRACRAAAGIREELPRLSAEWSAQLGRPLSLGIGLNSGPALVGNTGSRRKFKYGPFGHTINLASRTEGATKQFGIPCLITGSTRDLLGDAFATRRLCKVRVVGLQNPVDMYELMTEPPSPEWLRRRDAYEAALALFEEQKLAEACRALNALLVGQGELYDIPVFNLLARAVEHLRAPSQSFDSTWTLTSK